MKKVLAIFSLFVILNVDARAESARSADAIKAEILELAQRYAGQGDPDFSKQNSLNILVEELLKVAPQPPVSERLDLLYGTWYQVWGPYDYRGDDRGIDPNLTLDEIYQVIFAGGYYYNVTPLQKNDRIGLLRGKFKLVSDAPNLLKVRFTRFPGNRGRPEDLEIWELPALAEERELPDKTSIVPGIIVKLFFGGGYLREVYTDRDLRITYGSECREDRENEYIYIMTRVEPEELSPGLPSELEDRNSSPTIGE